MTETERQPSRQLTEDECWEHLSRAPYGRIASSAAGEIDIFPVNHRTDGHSLVFRTSAGTKLVELTIRSSVAFEIDGHDDREAFSVVVKGTAEEFDRDAEVRDAERLGVRPWAPEEKDRWVRITPTSVQGRAFDLVTGPSS
ncbi:pyridoxamine 5'-phosphate oxidase family protein [Microbacterium sp. LBN7]|uniref:pyridoxamine 5'-phosphate oxidase family protein n=1 Tax=Microbacterium sp. LBN7 TaxID=3129773 RepID=UPI003255438F